MLKGSLAKVCRLWRKETVASADLRVGNRGSQWELVQGRDSPSGMLRDEREGREDEDATPTAVAKEVTLMWPCLRQSRKDSPRVARAAGEPSGARLADWPAITTIKHPLNPHCFHPLLYSPASPSVCCCCCSLETLRDIETSVVV